MTETNLVYRSLQAEITRLRASNAEMREALDQIVRQSNEPEADDSVYAAGEESGRRHMGNIARAALDKQED
tara:strand:- start:317 stop:529 length:213 start_codon:yes stop_codon:yes gene_type:complete